MSDEESFEEEDGYEETDDSDNGSDVEDESIEEYQIDPVEDAERAEVV